MQSVRSGTLMACNVGGAASGARHFSFPLVQTPGEDVAI